MSLSDIKLTSEELALINHAKAIGKAKLLLKRLREVDLEDLSSLNAFSSYLHDNPIDARILVIALCEFCDMAKSAEMTDAVKIKNENDPKQVEKNIVKECWENWQNEPTQYKNNTRFATAMLDKFKPDNPDDDSKHLNSVAVITGWCREWKKEKSQSAS